MKIANKTIKNIIKKRIKEIHTALPAKIESYDATKMRAKINLLAKKELEGEQVEISPVIEVPVMHIKFGNIIVRPGYEKGDVVQVIFNEKALDKLLITGEPEEVEFKRSFSYDDAVVIGGLLIEQEKDYPKEEKKSLYICNIDEDVKLCMTRDGEIRVANDKKQVEIVMESDGIIRIADNENGTELKFDIENSGDAIFKLANKLFLGSSEADEGVPLGNKLKNWLDGHTHTGVATGSGTSGKPSSGSPDPSEKVMVE